MHNSEFRIQNSEFRGSRRYRSAYGASRCAASGRRPAFTLIELLVVLLIIGILASLVISVMAGAVEQARVQRTRSIITKIDQLIMEQYESYRTRPVPIRIPPGTNPRYAARLRLDALRELMRLEMPCCRGDVLDVPVFLKSRPALNRSYLRRVTATWDDANKESECLYLILSAMHDGDKSAIDFFTSDEIGDTDGDGMKEVLDSWGQPIIFLRWAPGYTEFPGPDGAWGVKTVDDDGDGIVDNVTEAGWPGSDDLVVPIRRQQRKAPDPFDPLRVDPRVDAIGNLPKYPPNTGTYSADLSNTNDTFALFPLIYSTGRDKTNGLELVQGYPTFSYAMTHTYNAISPPNDPYFSWVDTATSATRYVGQVLDPVAVADDITNFDQVTQ